jgi:hypothetical protein
MQLRQRHRMRADQKWVLDVARNPQARFGYDEILMSPAELQEFQARFTRMWSHGSKRNAMVQQAKAYAERQSDSFAGSYLRNASEYLFDPPVAYVLKFTGDLTVHRQALQNLPPANIPLEILPARFSLQQLEAARKAVERRYENLPDKDGIRFTRSAPDVYENVMTVEFESDLLDVAARLEAGFNGVVKVVVHPMHDASKRVAVTEGRGWRLLGRAEHRGGAHQEQATRTATSQAEWRELREATQITEPRRSVDFRKEIVLTFAQSISCGALQLVDVLIDQPLQSITPKFSRGGSPRTMCASAYVGYEVFAVAVDRTALPPNPITVPDQPWAEERSSPTYCPRGLVIPRR